MPDAGEGRRIRKREREREEKKCSMRGYTGISYIRNKDHLLKKEDEEDISESLCVLHEHKSIDSDTRKKAGKRMGNNLSNSEFDSCTHHLAKWRSAKRNARERKREKIRLERASKIS